MIRKFALTAAASLLTFTAFGSTVAMGVLHATSGKPSVHWARP